MKRQTKSSRSGGEQPSNLHSSDTSRSSQSVKQRTCPHCGESFRRSKNYYKHLSEEHGQSREHRDYKHFRNNKDSREPGITKQRGTGSEARPSVSRQEGPEIDVIQQDKYLGAEGSSSMRFICEESVCGAFFSRKKELRQHMNEKHGNVTRYYCKYSSCEVSFTRQRNLSYHVRTVHERSEKTCAICDRTFRRKNHLNEHMSQVHEQE